MVPGRRRFCGAIRVAGTLESVLAALGRYLTLRGRNTAERLCAALAVEDAASGDKKRRRIKAERAQVAGRAFSDATLMRNMGVWKRGEGGGAEYQARFIRFLFGTRSRA